MKKSTTPIPHPQPEIPIQPLPLVTASHHVIQASNTLERTLSMAQAHMTEIPHLYRLFTSAYQDIENAKSHLLTMHPSQLPEISTNQSLKEKKIAAIMILLQRDFPHFFPMDGSLPLPCGGMVFREIRDYYQALFGQTVISGSVIHRATRRLRILKRLDYCRGLAFYGHRYNLAGQPVALIPNRIRIQIENDLASH